ncbi:unnamed protein product [Meganyctiphanes norvegica]|uniref:Uncharacterized protein n=1 Tax=Meganyctiphanes norvegica TaxID=48144 RepID=A0AAV2RKC8_MEGNR
MFNMSRLAGSLSGAGMEALDRELRPVLERLYKLTPSNDQHPDLLWLSEWLAKPERSVEEFLCVLEDLYNNCDGNFLYVLRAAVEALSMRCPVLKGPWEDVVRSITEKTSMALDLQSYAGYYGPGSSSLSIWIIHVVGDPDLCPELRLQVLLLYRTMVKIDDNNCEQAQESLISACCFLNRHGQDLGKPVQIDDINCCLKLFDQYYYPNVFNFDMRLTKKLRNYRGKRLEILLHDVTHKYGMGIKVLTEPQELHGLIALIKFISDGAQILYKQFQDHDLDFDIDYVPEVARGLYKVVIFFRNILQEPEFLDVIAEAIMDVLEVVVVIMNGEYDEDFIHGPLCLVNDLLEEGFLVNDYVFNNPVGQEITRRFNNRICKISSLISADFLDNYPMIYDIIHFDCQNNIQGNAYIREDVSHK